MFDYSVFDIVFVLKCKSENGKGYPNDPDRFQPYVVVCKFVFVAVIVVKYIGN